MIFQTIVALATPPLPSALAIIRLTGQDVFSLVEKISDQSFGQLTQKTVLFGRIKDGQEVIDQVVFLVFVAPQSFTGDHVVEIICHGSMVVVHQILTLAIQHGARQAEPGEFSLRAYLNHKIDLVQAEAVHDMIQAPTPEAKRLAIQSLEGNTSALLAPLRTKIADLLALMEVNIDYPEYEDIGQVSIEKTKQETLEMLAMIEPIIAQAEQSRYIHEGITVAIIGRPNVGKSSLLNALFKEEKAIVTPFAGTTRDVVEASFNMDGLLIKLLDTAGIRDHAEAIETIGIEKSKQSIQKADLVLMVVDATDAWNQEDHMVFQLIKDKKHLLVYNKSDLIHDKEQGKLYISALKKDISSLKKAILTLFEVHDQRLQQPSFYQSRHIGELKQIQSALKKAHEDAHHLLTIDLLAASLQDAYFHTVTLLGLEGSSALASDIFSRFCVGK
jgi:tRNA modification GTPase